MGKSLTLAVASAAPTPTAAAATKQSAWWRVMPLAAYSRRQRPERWPSTTPSGASRSAATRRRAAASSGGRNPRHISSTDTTDTHGSTPWRRRVRRRSAAARPLSASIKTVVSSNRRDTLNPTVSDRCAAAREPTPQGRHPSRVQCRRLNPKTPQSHPTGAHPQDNGESGQR